MWLRVLLHADRGAGDARPRDVRRRHGPTATGARTRRTGTARCACRSSVTTTTCDGLTDGTSVDFDALNCGGCGHICPYRPAGPACGWSSCAITRAGLDGRTACRRRLSAPCIPDPTADESVRRPRRVCDGLVDEDFVDPVRSRPVRPRSVCRRGENVHATRPPATSDTTCDSLDDDCDRRPTGRRLPLRDGRRLQRRQPVHVRRLPAVPHLPRDGSPTAPPVRSGCAAAATARTSRPTTRICARAPGCAAGAAAWSAPAVRHRPLNCNGSWADGCRWTQDRRRSLRQLRGCAAARTHPAAGACACDAVSTATRAGATVARRTARSIGQLRQLRRALGRRQAAPQAGAAAAPFLDCNKLRGRLRVTTPTRPTGGCGLSCGGTRRVRRVQVRLAVLSCSFSWSDGCEINPLSVRSAAAPAPTAAASTPCAARACNAARGSSTAMACGARLRINGALV